MDQSSEQQQPQRDGFFAQMSASEKKRHLIAAMVTTLVMVLVAIVCVVVCYYPPDPPIPEEGVEVAMGFDEQGFGESVAQQDPANNTPASAADDHVTQSSESTVSLPANSQGRTVHPKTPAKPTQQQKEETTNSKALYTGSKRNGQDGSGQGNTQGSGQQGSPNGVVGSSNYSGNGVGAHASLKGRSAVDLPTPSYGSNIQGRIVVKVWVNQQGKVTKVDAPWEGTTISDARLVGQAREAALRAQFTPDAQATFSQTGTITYVYRIQ